MARVNDVRQRLGGDPTVGQFLLELVDDLVEQRTQFIALLAKLDLDAAVADEDYESSLTPAALKTTKGVSN